jgi:PAS domain S-box-containing protein
METEKTEAQPRPLIERLPAIVYILEPGDPDKWLYVSPQIETILGFAPQQWANEPGLPLQQVHPADRHSVQAVRRGRYAPGETFSLEYRVFASDGRLVWLHDRAALIDGDEGGPRLLQGMLVDITGRKQAEQRSRLHTGQLSIMSEVGNALTETLDLPNIFDRLSQATHKLLPDIATLFVSLYDSNRKLITAAHGVQDGQLVDVAQLPPIPLQPPGQGTQSEVIHTGEPLIINNLQDKLSTSTTRIRVGQAGPDTQSALYVPLRARGKVIGILQVQSYTPDSFSRADADLLTLVGNTAAIAIQNARLFSENMDRLDTIGALYSNAQKLSFNRDMQRLVHDVVRTCVQGYGATLAWLGRAEPDGSIKLLMHYPEEADYARRMIVRWDETHLGAGPTGRAIRTGFPVVTDDIQDDSTMAPWHELAHEAGLRCSVALPLVVRDQPIGVLALYHNQPGFFNPQRVSFLQAYAHQVAAALDNARLFEETQQRLKQLQALHAIDLAINASVSLPLTLKIVLEQATTHLRVDAGAVLIYNAHTQTLDHIASRGFHGHGISRTHLRLGEGHAGRAALDRQTKTVADLRAVPDNPGRMQLLANENFVFYYAEPLIAKGQIQGVFEIFHRAPLDPDIEWLDFLETIASQTATAIQSAQLFDNLQRTNLELALAYDTTLEGWSRAMDLRDKETEGHTQRVTDMTVRMAQAMGLPEDDILHMRRGALLHDIGKMGVPDHILLKPDKLTEDEWARMKMHPVYAYEMLSPIAYLHRSLDIPYCHHEMWDGAGYPRGLKGEQIPLPARIFAVVDVWDALRSDRPYRQAWPAEKVRGHIRALSGSHFDPRVVEEFLRIF